MQRKFKQNEKDFVLQNIFLTDDFYETVLLWFATLNKDSINIYCKEIITLLLDQYGADADYLIENLDVQSVYDAVKEVSALMNH